MTAKVYQYSERKNSVYQDGSHVSLEVRVLAANKQDAARKVRFAVESGLNVAFPRNLADIAAKLVEVQAD